MRLSDLLQNEVIDQHGHHWGHVHDIHLVQDGPILASGTAALRLHGLVAGRNALGTRLGYTGRHGYDAPQHTRGPLPIKLLMRWLNRHAVYIPWTAITSIDSDHVQIRAPEDGFAGRPTT